MADDNPPVIGAGTVANGSFAGPMAGTGASGPDRASGTILFSDADSSETHSVAIIGVAASGVIGGLPDQQALLSLLSTGTLREPAGGAEGGVDWTFDAPGSLFNYLAVGETATLTYQLKITDSDGGEVSQDVTIEAGQMPTSNEYSYSFANGLGPWTTWLNDTKTSFVRRRDRACAVRGSRAWGWRWPRRALSRLESQQGKRFARRARRQRVHSCKRYLCPFVPCNEPGRDAQRQLLDARERKSLHGRGGNEASRRGPALGRSAMIRRAVILSFLALSACSTVQSLGGGPAMAALGPSERIQLRVRTGNDQMDALVYELAYQQFADVLPLREKQPYTGALEITFASTAQSGFLGTGTTIATGHAASTGWYTGGQVVSTTLTGGTFLEWQNSTMLAVLKRDDGERLWSADYSYKGGWELSGWVVNTPEEAARLIVKRLKARFVADKAK